MKFIKRFFKNPFKSRRRIAITFIAIVILTIFSGLLYVKFALAATATWTNTSGDGKWSTCSNWSGGTGTGGCPGASDIATFNGTSTADSSIDASFAGSVAGVSITAAYTGTITASHSLTVGASGFSQAGGTWSGGSQTFTISGGNFTVSAGTHTATTGTWTANRNITYSGGTLDMTGATLKIIGSTSSDDTTVACSASGSQSIGGTINIQKAGGGSFTLSANCTINTNIINSDFGNLDNMVVSGTLNNTGSTFTITDGNFTVNTTGTVTYSGTVITMTSNFTQSGTFDLTGITLTFSGSSFSDPTTIACSSNATQSINGTINITKTGGVNTTLSANCTINVGSINMTTSNLGTLTINGTMNHTGSTFIVTDTNLTIGAAGTITYSGSNITVGENYTRTSGGTFDLTGKTITFNGNNVNDNSTVNCTGSIGGTTVVSKTSSGDFTVGSGCTVDASTVAGSTIGTLTVNGTLNVSTTFDLNSATAGEAGLVIGASGVVTFAGSSITINGSFTNNGTFDLTGKTVSFDGSGAGNNSTINCANTTFNNLTINKSSSGSSTTLTGNCSVTGDFTRTDGLVNNPGSAVNYTVGGNFSMSQADGFGGANLTITMATTSGTKTITQNAGTMSGKIIVNNSAGAVTQLATNLTTGSTCDVSGGVFDIHGHTFTCGSTFSVNNGGTWQLYGSETTTLPTVNSGSTIAYTGNGDSSTTAYTIKDLSYYNLTIASTDSGDTFATPNSTEDALGSFSLSGGTFTAPSGNFTVGGNFARTGGTFTPGTGTVIFNDATQTSVVSGSTTFNGFASSTQGKTIQFTAGTTQTISGSLTMAGNSSNRISLLSTSSPTRWNIIANGTISVDAVAVQDSDASGGTTILATNSTNLGHNVNWSFFNPGTINVQGGVNFRGGVNVR